MKRLISLFFLPLALSAQDLTLNNLGAWGTDGYADVVLQNQIAYCAADEGGIDILSVTGGSVTRLGRSSFYGNVLGIAVQGDYAYLALGFDGMAVVDVSNPADPREVGRAYVTTNIQDIVVEGNVVYATSINRLVTFDVSNPEAPSLYGTWSKVLQAQDMAVNNGFLYVADGRYGLRVLDVRNPRAPKTLGFERVGTAYAVAVDGHRAVVGTSANLYVYNIDKPRPQQLSSKRVSKVFSLAFHNDDIIVESYGRIDRYSVATSSRPQLMDSLETDAAYTLGIAIENDTVVLAQNNEGLQVLDRSGEGLAEVTRFDESGSLYRISTDGTFAYLAGDPGFQVIDLSDPTTPVRVALHEENYYGLGVASGSERTVFAAYDHLSVYQQIGSSHPTPTTTWQHDGSLQDLAFANNHLWTTHRAGSGETGLRSLDLRSAKALPTTALITPGSAEGVAIDDDVAVIADGNYGICVVDIQDPQQPQHLGTCDTESFAKHVAIHNNLAYVAAGYEGLQVVSLQNTHQPTLIANISCPGETARLFVHGDLLLAANRVNGLQIYSLANPTQPVRIGSFFLPRGAEDVTAYGNTILVAGRDGTMRVLAMSFNSTSVADYE